MKDKNIDFSDIPELTDEYLQTKERKQQKNGSWKEKKEKRRKVNCVFGKCIHKMWDTDIDYPDLDTDGTWIFVAWRRACKRRCFGAGH